MKFDDNLCCEVPTRDLENRTDVHDLVVDFYREIVFDDVVGPMFTEIAEVDWPTHLPLLIDYWCLMLFGERGYDGLTVPAHRRVHENEPLRPEHFERWIQLFEASIDKSWAGPNADHAKRSARRVAAMLSRKLSNAATPTHS